MIRFPYIVGALLLMLFFACSAAAQEIGQDKLTGKTLETAISFAQSLSQWGYIVLGGSLAVLLGTSHDAPRSRWLRMFYFLFAPAWLFLGLSIHQGTRAQEAYLAYLFYPVITINEASRQISGDIRSQIFWLYWGLRLLCAWLFLYLIWWVIWKKQDDGERAKS